MAKSESTKIEFGYFHDYESEQFAFYRIPKVLFTDEYFRNLSSDAKVLYGLMLDRMALSIRNNWVDNEGKVVESGKKTGTVWDNITSTADNMPATKIPATFKIDLDGNINYVNPETGTNTLWTNSNATKHMGEYVSRFGDESWSIGTRSQAMLESYSASLNKAMETIGTETPGRYFGTYGNWELGINTETGVVYHARMIN